MAVDPGIVATHLPFLPPELQAGISAHGELAEVGPLVTLLKPGQYVRVIPIVLKGLVKVFTQAGDKELLLYFIRPSESCVMSFSAIINNDKSRIFAQTELYSLLLLLPSDRLQTWVQHGKW
jgi:CRP/FNR family transcriptional regulator